MTDPRPEEYYSPDQRLIHQISEELRDSSEKICEQLEKLNVILGRLIERLERGTNRNSPFAHALRRIARAHEKAHGLSVEERNPDKNGENHVG